MVKSITGVGGMWELSESEILIRTGKLRGPCSSDGGSGGLSSPESKVELSVESCAESPPPGDGAMSVAGEMTTVAVLMWRMVDGFVGELVSESDEEGLDSSTSLWLSAERSLSSLLWPCNMESPDSVSVGASDESSLSLS